MLPSVSGGRVLFNVNDNLLSRLDIIVPVVILKLGQVNFERSHTILLVNSNVIVVHLVHKHAGLTVTLRHDCPVANVRTAIGTSVIARVHLHFIIV